MNSSSGRSGTCGHEGTRSGVADVRCYALIEQTEVLHVPFTYFPHKVGGTEIYVAGLAKALRPHGFLGAVAAPGEIDSAYDHEGIPVFRFAIERRADLAAAYGASDSRAAQSFQSLLARLRPRIVHLHARSAAVSERLVNLAHEVGAKTVFTYHTPTVSCARGTMMWMGRGTCDGRLDRHRCTLCTLAQHGVPPLLRDVLARTPRLVSDAVGYARVAGGLLTALRLPSLIGAAHRDFRELAKKVGVIIAPCDWVCEVLRRNGVPESKLVLCRQGLVRYPGARVGLSTDSEYRHPGDPLRLGYFGRLDSTKGIDIVIRALREAPNASVVLAIYGIRQPGYETYSNRLEQVAAGDARVAFRPELPPDSVGQAMRRCDLVVVPSRGLETGPLVVLEAFAAGTPVLGARLGGIAELVTDQVDGVLVPPDDPAAWASAITALAADPEQVARLRVAVRPPRTMNDVASDMSELYRRLLDSGKKSPSPPQRNSA